MTRPIVGKSGVRLSALPFGGRRGRSAFCRLSMVDYVLKFFAGLEIRDLLGRHFHARGGFRIAANARLTLPRAETAKAADLNLVTRSQRPDNAVKNRFPDDFTVFTRQPRKTRNLFNQIGFGHGIYST